SRLEGARRGAPPREARRRHEARPRGRARRSGAHGELRARGAGELSRRPRSARARRGRERRDSPGRLGHDRARRPLRSIQLHSNRLTSLEQARRIAALTQEKLARDVVIMDMQPVCSYTDYFVVATGNNPRQTKAIWDEVYAVLKRDERLL